MPHCRPALPSLLVAALLVTAACGGKSAPDEPMPEAPPSTYAPIVGMTEPTPSPISGMDADTMEGAGARRLAALNTPIQFGYDRADLSDDARQVLDAKVAAMSDDRNVRLGIEGHADERGSDEYNLALGMRRATAAKRYLTMKGVSDARFETVSYGEEHPSASGHDEASYAQNRRAAFTVNGGGVAAR